MKINDTEITVVSGSVIDQDVAVIVNAAKTSMRGGGGIDGAIHRGAGREMIAELVEKAPNGKSTGEPVMTKGYKLKQPYVLHVAGPIFRGGNNSESALLEASYRNCMKMAHDAGLDSIGFCSISTGLYSYPIEDAAWRSLKVVTDFIKSNPATPIKKVVFAMYRPGELIIFQRALEVRELKELEG